MTPALAEVRRDWAAMRRALATAAAVSATNEPAVLVCHNRDHDLDPGHYPATIRAGPLRELFRAVAR